MSVIAESFRVLVQLVAYTVAQRRLALLVFVLIGVAAVALSLASSAAAPVLIYPLL